PPVGSASPRTPDIRQSSLPLSSFPGPQPVPLEIDDFVHWVETAVVHQRAYPWPCPLTTIVAPPHPEPSQVSPRPGLHIHLSCLFFDRLLAHARTPLALRERSLITLLPLGICPRDTYSRPWSWCLFETFLSSHCADIRSVHPKCTIP